MKTMLYTFMVALLLSACSNPSNGIDVPDEDSTSTETWNDLTISSTQTMTTPFVGNGPQWGGYDNIKAWTGSATLNEGDWAKLFTRMDYMRPGLIRIMTAPGWNYIKNNVYNPSVSNDVLFKILDYCQTKGISVMFGEWGQPALNGNKVDTAWLTKSVRFLDYMMHTKAYTCLKFYNMCNEPAGSWSSIGGDYALWQSTYEEIMKRLEAKGLNSKIAVIAPDVAVWDLNLTSWITRANSFFGDKIGAYDVHTYPTDVQVKGTDYGTMIAGYRAAAPKDKAMIMGELGFKYSAESALGVENLKRIANDPYASEDANMMVYDAFYGVDMADAVIQNMDAGYNGVILWDLDDAMYNVSGKKLKRWGFWNILGEDAFGGISDEAIRPWFYPMALMCRYFPKGSTIFKANLPNKKGIRAIGGMKDGKYTMAVSNSYTITYTVNLKIAAGPVLTNASCYSYIASESGPSFEGTIDANGFPKPYAVQTIDFSKNKSFKVTLKPRSFLLITNIL